MSDTEPPRKNGPKTGPHSDDQDFFGWEPAKPRDSQTGAEIVEQYRSEASRDHFVENEPKDSEPVTSEPVEIPAEKKGWLGRKKKVEAAPPPPPSGNGQNKKKSRAERSRSPFIAGANAALTFLVVLLLAGLVVVHYAYKSFDAPGPLQAETDVVVPRGSGPRDIAERLLQAKAISSSTLFVAGTQLTGNRGKLKAGEYRIPAGASMRQIMTMIAEGDVINHTVTIPEGLTSKQIVDRLLNETILSGTVTEIPAEGTLLPETYQVERGTDRNALLRRMAAAQKKLLDEVWEKRDRSVPVKTPHELVTLASIVEKETGVASERPHVASVFVNRLNRKMRLQSDPTIIYGLVGGQGTLGRPILRSEITKPTPYNTYTIPALPPGPIANPGRASMQAAANPLTSKDLYFVADGTGGHAFAETLQQHNANVARWRRLQRAADNDRAPVDAEPPAN